MNKTEKMRGVVALCGVALTNLNEVREALTNELKTLFKALEVEDQDTEKIEDPQLYSIALELEDSAHNLEYSARDLESVLKDLEKIKV